jgi:5-methylthioribose kinase
LVHADFSPKNLLLYPGGMMLVDFETGHWGDPAFDLGFFLSHLLLKAVYHAPAHEPFVALAWHFLRDYNLEFAQRIDLDATGQGLGRISLSDQAALERRATLNLAGCLWARLDGTSQIEYLEDAGQREWIRGVCRRLLTDEPLDLGDALKLFGDIPPAVGRPSGSAGSPQLKGV